MTGTKLRQYLPALADIFAESAAGAMLLWSNGPSDEEIGGRDPELYRAERVTELYERCQSWMRQTLASEEVQKIISAIEDGTVEPDPEESRR